jgi:transcription initiation factor TFIIIB Brf1 subunit/transcription initiation factor TFIIB
MWYIIMCPYCSLIQIVRSNQKYRVCYRCGKVIRLDYSKVRILYRSDNLNYVNYALQKLKELQVTGKLK